LSGCDYIKNIKNIGLKTAHRLVFKNPTLSKLATALRQLKISPEIMSSYLLQLEQALLTFSHQVVYNTITKKLDYLSPLPTPLYILSGSANKETREDVSFLGPMFDDVIAHVEGKLLRIDDNIYPVLITAKPLVSDHTTNASTLNYSKTVQDDYSNTKSRFSTKSNSTSFSRFNSHFDYKDPDNEVVNIDCHNTKRQAVVWGNPLLDTATTTTNTLDLSRLVDLNVPCGVSNSNCHLSNKIARQQQQHYQQSYAGLRLYDQDRISQTPNGQLYDRAPDVEQSYCDSDNDLWGFKMSDQHNDYHQQPLQQQTSRSVSSNINLVDLPCHEGFERYSNYGRIYETKGHSTLNETFDNKLTALHSNSVTRLSKQKKQEQYKRAKSNYLVPSTLSSSIHIRGTGLADSVSQFVSSKVCGTWQAMHRTHRGITQSGLPHKNPSVIYPSFDYSADKAHFTGKHIDHVRDVIAEKENTPGLSNIYHHNNMTTIGSVVQDRSGLFGSSVDIGFKGLEMFQKDTECTYAAGSYTDDISLIDQISVASVPLWSEPTRSVKLGTGILPLNATEPADICHDANTSLLHKDSSADNSNIWPLIGCDDDNNNNNNNNNNNDDRLLNAMCESDQLWFRPHVSRSVDNTNCYNNVDNFVYTNMTDKNDPKLYVQKQKSNMNAKVGCKRNREE
jgi:hypothetical protein